MENGKILYYVLIMVIFLFPFLSTLCVIHCENSNNHFSVCFHHFVFRLWMLSGRSAIPYHRNELPGSEKFFDLQ